MAFFVHVTEACAEDAKQHGVLDHVLRIRQRVEEAGNYVGFGRMGAGPFLKRQVGNFRLVAWSKQFDDDVLLVFCRVFARGKRQYEKFLRTSKDKPSEAEQELLDLQGRSPQDIYGERRRTKAPSTRQAPSDDEKRWLYPTIGSHAGAADEMLLESGHWVEKLRSSRYREKAALYGELLTQLFVDRDGLERSESLQDVKVHWAKREQIGIAYVWPENTQEILLIAPLRRGEDPNQIIASHRRAVRELGGTLENARQLAARAYPVVMLLDEDSWLEIEKDEDANLALSPEEAALLNGIRTPSSESPAHFPLFINGRAGSGKSTMLHYLLADYIEYALRNDLRQRILYVTASADLAERARGVVRRLLGVHHERLMGPPLPAERVEEVVQGSVVVFHDFLYSLLPPEERGRFPRARFVDFPKFRRLWGEMRAQRRTNGTLTPDLAWHTVRSYIKGLGGYQSYLDPHEFAALPRRQRSLSVETYERVWKEVWQGWYAKLGEEGYWDDQDLVARVLELDLPRTQDCAAIFCDEAQDFTSLDLEVIFQLSLFGRRSLTPEEFQRVPIVFAGDPLQTINPTGFRWDAVQADYHEKFAAVLDSRRWGDKPRISFRELSFNYRSNPGIVRFCNLVQLGRAVALDLRELEAQKPWRVTDPIQVQLVELDGDTADKLRGRPDLVKIVNCEAGEETDLVRADPWLRDAVTEEIDGVFRNVLSPARAKGLEFPAVVLYRFGDTAPEEFYQALQGDLDPEARLPVEYFFNRLYVAASRAKTQLFIADTREAIQGFWRWATDTEAFDQLTQRVARSEEQRQQWVKMLGQPVPADREWWTGHQLSPTEQAVDYERDGESKRDPYLLRQAAIAYRNAGDQRRAERCLAKAAECEGRYSDAGERYQQLDMRADAYRCFWNAQEWRRLCSLAERVADLANRVETHAARFMANGKFRPEFVEFLVSIGVDERAAALTSEDPVWTDVLRESFERLKGAKEDNALPWAALCGTFVTLRPHLREIDSAGLAEFAFRGEDFARAIRLWEEAGHTEHEQYYRAHAATTGFPEKISWLFKAGDHREVVETWRECASSLPDKHLVVQKVLEEVHDAARQVGDCALALDLLPRVLSAERARKLLHVIHEGGEDRLLPLAAELVVRANARELKKWVPLRHFLRGDTSSGDSLFVERADKPSPQVSAASIHAKLDEAGYLPGLVRVLFEELSTSNALAEKSQQDKANLNRTLEEYFLSPDGCWFPVFDLSPRLVGAVIERSCGPENAERYYRELLALTDDRALALFATERLIVTIEEKAKSVRGTRQSPSEMDQLEEARRLRRNHRLEGKEIPRFPDVSALEAQNQVETCAAVPPQGERILGPLRIEWSVPKRLVRVSHRDRLETVKLDLSVGALRGDGDTEFVPIPTEPGQQAWEIPAWPARIVVQNHKGRQLVRISTADEHTDVELGS